jgi:hypothetical protein
MASNQTPDISETELPLNWKIALRVWWAIAWRAMILAMVAGGLMTLAMNIVGRDDETISLIFYIIGIFVSVVLEVWLIHHALSQNYGSFRIAIIKKSREGNQESG